MELHINRLGHEDIALAFREALSRLTPGTPSVFRLDPGTYRLEGSHYQKRFCAISNHDSGERAVAFDFSGHSDIEFDGGGAHFQCVGRVIPFLLENCRGITLRNFTLDWERPFFTEGEILEVGKSGEVRLQVDRGKYPLQVANGRLIFLGQDYESAELDNAIEIDAALMEVAAHARDTWGIRTQHEALEWEDGSITLSAPFMSRAEAGNILVIPHELRTSPAIVLSFSRDLVIEDIALHQSGGMGVIAQLCDNVTVRRMQAGPGRERASYTSLNADVTHFVECTGDLLLQNCDFSGQMDDSSNVHGVYLRAKEALSRHEMIVEAAHAQQGCVDYFSAGNRITTVDPASFAPLSPLHIESIKRLDNLHCVYRTREPLPDNLVGKLIESADRKVSFLAEHNNFHHYRTDGLLVSAPGKLRVRHNRFSVPGHGVLVTCDCGEWFESSRVDDLVIEHNTFENCAYGQRPNPSSIRIAPNDTKGEDPSATVHRNITIRDNRFIGRPPFVSYYRAEDLTIEGNTFLDEAGAPAETGAILHTAVGHSG